MKPLLNLNQYNAERIMELPLYPGCKHESETLRYVCKKSNDCEKCMAIVNNFRK